MKLSVRDMILVALFAALMVVGAYLRIPNPLFPAVPITFQLFFCIYAGLLLGARLGFLSQLIYLALGLVGLPVFSGGGGIHYVLSPTFGFILGFVLCGAVVGWMSDRQKPATMMGVLGAGIAGLLLIYLVGDLYMYGVLNLYLGNDVGLVGLAVSMVPYMVKDLVLVMIAAITSMQILPVLRRNRLALQ